MSDADHGRALKFAMEWLSAPYDPQQHPEWLNLARAYAQVSRALSSEAPPVSPSESECRDGQYVDAPKPPSPGGDDGWLEIIETLAETRRLVSRAAENGFADEEAVLALFSNNWAITVALSKARSIAGLGEG